MNNQMQFQKQTIYKAFNKIMKEQLNRLIMPECLSNDQ